MLGKLVGSFVVLLVGFKLYPTINKQITLVSTASSNVTDASSTMLSLVPLMFVLTISATVIMMISQALNEAGLFDGSSSEEYEIPEKPKKQTYLDYVRERLTVEKMFKWRI